MDEWNRWVENRIAGFQGSFWCGLFKKEKKKKKNSSVTDFPLSKLKKTSEEPKRKIKKKNP